MNAIYEHLLALTGRLELPSGTLPDAMAPLRRSLATSFIQDHPGALPVEPDPALDPEINEAAAEGVRLAAELAQSRTRLRLVADSYLSPPTRRTDLRGSSAPSSRPMAAWCVSPPFGARRCCGSAS